MNTIGPALTPATCDSHSEANYTSFQVLGDTIASARGQTFTGDGGIVTSAKFYLKKSNSPTMDLVAKIYEVTGTHGTNAVPTGDPVATSNTINASTISASFGLVTFTFTDGITVSLNQNYAVICEALSSNESDNVAIGVDFNSGHSGNQTRYTTSWTAIGIDIIFYVYTNILVGSTLLLSALVNENFAGLADGSFISNEAILPRHIEVQEGWTNFTLLNSWVTYSVTYGTPQYFKDSLGWVHMHGLVKNGTSASAVIATLPAGYRPDKQEIFTTLSADVSCRLDIYTNGNIACSTGASTAWITLSGITFKAV